MPPWREAVAQLGPSGRILLVVAVAITAHLLVQLVRSLARRMRGTRLATRWVKLLTLTSLVTSGLVFAIWFSAIGLLLTEAGLDLKTWFASATIIGLAVGFGSQGLVQDVVTGLTLVFSDLVDVGDMIEVSGQTGIVSSVGMRFVVITNYLGAQVYVPNRTINNVVSYPKGYVRALVDIRLPTDPEHADRVASLATDVVMGAWQQFPGLCLAPPSVEGRFVRPAGGEYLRLKMRIWPGQAALLDPLRAELADVLKGVDEKLAAWRVTLTLETEEKHLTVGRRRP